MYTNGYISTKTGMTIGGALLLAVAAYVAYKNLTKKKQRKRR
jgi:hypothetical protein